MWHTSNSDIMIQIIMFKNITEACMKDLCDISSEADSFYMLYQWLPQIYDTTLFLYMKPIVAQNLLVHRMWQV